MVLPYKRSVRKSGTRGRMLKESTGDTEGTSQREGSRLEPYHAFAKTHLPQSSRQPIRGRLRMTDRGNAG